MTIGTILVTGATGAQGGATTLALLAEGCQVRVLVRDKQAPGARALAARGALLCAGDFDDATSLDAALAGADGVFSMQLPSPPEDPDREVRTGTTLIDAAYRAGVTTFVHSSVARAGDQTTFVGWDEGRWWPGYWNGKSAVNEAVVARGFAHHVILKPAFMMENFAMPKAAGMFPAMRDGILEGAYAADATIDLIAAADIGAFAAAAFADPHRFDGAAIDLAAESMTLTEIAAALTAGTGRAVIARSLSHADAIASGIYAGVADSQSWNNVEGYRVDIPAVRRRGIPLTPLAAWIAANRDRIVIDRPA